ncbi:hypothetical protein Q1695_013141 [Nippostrongylus brasiliensis]|nr:hypothetical protein Q1695_013141 [Nippostrongylus brasiliensis]
MIRSSLVLLFCQLALTTTASNSYLPIVAYSGCADRGLFCRFVKSFCNNPEHEVIMKRDCASTCQFCDIPEENETNATEIYLPNGTRFRHYLPIQRKKNSTTAGRKCVFPAEKTLNATPQPMESVTSNNTVENENHTTPQNGTVTEQSRKIAIVIKPPTNGTSVARPKSSGQNSNKVMIEYLKSRNKPTAAPATAVYNVSVTPSKESFEVRKVKLEELMNAKDKLPKITTAEIESFTVSLSKTLIKGKCLDEYTYCREFSSLCQDPTFNDVMARHCTLTCKRCDEVEMESEFGADCFDTTPDCRSHAKLCTHSKYRQLMKDTCAKTCNMCNPVCKDRHQNCQRFVQDGFCTDEMYTNEERRHLCGVSCKFC